MCKRVAASYRSLTTRDRRPRGLVNTASVGDVGKVAPPDTTVVTWLPFYHDLGLMCGLAFPIVAGLRAAVMSPMAFLQKPARWMQTVARSTRTYTRA